MAKKRKRYGFRNAVERLQYIRHAIEREEGQLHSEEWAVDRRKSTIARLEHDRDKVQKGIVVRP